jgi:hypothetical protein
MPIRRRQIAHPDPRADQLREILVEEWQSPREDEGRPIIIEEKGSPNRPTHLYVIWDEWESLSQQERSEIIMDAYEKTRGGDAALLVTLAMGLTRQEADRMGIRWE